MKSFVEMLGDGADSANDLAVLRADPKLPQTEETAIMLDVLTDCVAHMQHISDTLLIQMAVQTGGPIH